MLPLVVLAVSDAIAAVLSLLLLILSVGWNPC